MKSGKPNNRSKSDRRTDDTTDYHGAAGEQIGVTDGGQPVVAERGDGGLTEGDHLKDERSSERVYPFELASTTFYANKKDAKGNPIDEEKYGRLWRYQHEWDDDSIGRRTHRDKTAVAEALASSLGLSKGQKNRVRGIAANLNGRKFNRNGGIEGLALGAIAYVGDQDAQNNKSLEYRILGRDEFNKLCDQHEVDGWKACKKIKKMYQELYCEQMQQ